MPTSKSPKAREPVEADPNRLVRQKDGGYRSEDERFAVNESNGTWFIADHEAADDFGLPRVAGPFPTLKAVRESLPEVRNAPASARRPIRQPKSTKKPAVPRPTPKTWLDRLSSAQRSRATRIVEALTELGLEDAEQIARRRIEGQADSTLARRLVRARLDRLIADADADDVGAVAEAVARELSQGRVDHDLPGWALVETDPEGSPTDRRIPLD